MDRLDWGKLRDQAIVLGITIALLWVGFSLIGRVLHIVVVLLLAVVLAYALEPALALAEKVLPRAVAALLIYALALGLLAAAILVLGPPLVQQSEAAGVRLPQYLKA